jgi:hypothetical protein
VNLDVTIIVNNELLLQSHSCAFSFVANSMCGQQTAFVQPGSRAIVRK